VLRDNDGEPRTARQIADEINARGLYKRRDGAAVDLGQIHARVHAYDRMFNRGDGGITLAGER
jgi:hypothetical protein